MLYSLYREGEQNTVSASSLINSISATHTYSFINHEHSKDKPVAFPRFTEGSLQIFRHYELVGHLLATNILFVLVFGPSSGVFVLIIQDPHCQLGCGRKKWGAIKASEDVGLASFFRWKVSKTCLPSVWKSYRVQM